MASSWAYNTSTTACECTCPTCNKVLKSRQGVRDHSHVKHNVCRLCDTKCSPPMDLHLQNCHSVYFAALPLEKRRLRRRRKSKKNIIRPIALSCKNQRTHPCPITDCSKVCRGAKGLLDHTRDKHNGSSPPARQSPLFYFPPALQTSIAAEQWEGTGFTADFLQGNPNSLESFVVEELQPTEETNRQAQDCVQRLVTLLQHNVDYSVKRVVKSGSFGKGTQVKGFADLDCVAVLNNIKDFRELKDKRKDILDNLGKKIETNWQATVEIEKETTFAVQFGMTVGGETMKVDLLPTFDVLRQKKTLKEVYRDILSTTSSNQQFYSAALCQYQIEFIQKQLTRVKNLIRLVKYWNKKVVKKLARHGEKYPTSYPMELITIHVWEKAGEPSSFDMAMAFKAVLHRLTNYQTIRAVWYDNYDAEMASKGMIGMRSPILLDPANPTNNVFSASTPDALDHVADIARETTNKPLLRDVKVFWPWI
ncbi:2'-5'-oligoadenylate synthase 1-like [Glandiceps talaboti]